MTRFNRHNRSITAALLLLFCSASVAQAAVTLTFSGTYDTSGTTVFGLTGSAVPFSYQITYDPALDTNSIFVPAGSTVDGLTLLNDWYGYSASGITALNATFGTKTWTLSDLKLLTLDSAHTMEADLFFDADISLSTPIRSDIYFLDSSDSDLSLGRAVHFLSTIEMDDKSVTADVDGGIAFSTPMTITSTVPEPGPIGFVALCGIALLRRWQTA